MPGGSVNGRPFRESADSYSKTGIPCGNPKRFRSQDVVRMEAGQRSKALPLAGPPVEGVETEGQRQLQALLQKQINTKTSLQEELQKRKEFCRGAEYRSGTEELVGVVQLGQYRSQENTDTYLEDLRAYGLTNEEILYLLQHEQDEQTAKRSKLSNPEYHAARIQEIQDKISQKQREWKKTDSFSGAKQVSRHAMEIEQTLSTPGDQNSFLHRALVKEVEKPGTSGEVSNDPMDSLPAILESVTKRKHRRRKKHTDGYKSSCTLECCNPDPTSSTCSHSCEHGHCDNTLCDNDSAGVPTCIEKPVDYVSRLEPDTPTDKESKKTDVPAKGTRFTVNMNQSDVEGNIVSDDGGLRVLPYVEPVPEESILKYKVSAEEVRKLPRFENYQPGEPTTVLYLKNLSRKITETDLASLFVGFQEPSSSRIIFKLLTGRMKGQAFVTFPDVDTASKALNIVHGYDFKGKPVIIQFGKKQDV